MNNCSLAKIGRQRNRKTIDIQNDGQDEQKKRQTDRENEQVLNAKMGRQTGKYIDRQTERKKVDRRIE